ncbi:uncharacterized protein LOC133741213 isoform X2 [Rosa rugosa]|uniref:uncharacterized protein LOC133741213 isoform X2 n=1 Tax=Rosa rugosa TaxID=74645 RepID=UPI002B411434|nr:uncharacterized protein LOC133741213 isoform X2 [Rosa rugosa]
MDRYQRIEKPREETPINENEIRITTQGRIRNYITYATTLLQEKGSNEISLKAMGRAINKTVMITELIKRRVAGLHQNTYIGSTDITDMWEPLEEGLLPLETTRHVSVITVTLSKKELDTSSTGYQGPIPADQVKPWTEYDYEGQGPPSMRGRGRGRGRGRRRGNFSNGVMVYNADGGFDGGRGYGGFDGGRGYGGFEGGRGYGGRGQGHGRVRGYRGRVRGYGSGSMQPESGGYTVYNDYGGGAPTGQGRRERGPGRARGGGRGVGGRLDGPIQSAV